MHVNWWVLGPWQSFQSHRFFHSWLVHSFLLQSYHKGLTVGNAEAGWQRQLERLLPSPLWEGSSVGFWQVLWLLHGSFWWLLQLQLCGSETQAKHDIMTLSLTNLFPFNKPLQQGFSLYQIYLPLKDKNRRSQQTKLWKFTRIDDTVFLAFFLIHSKNDFHWVF